MGLIEQARASLAEAARIGRESGLIVFEDEGLEDAENGAEEKAGGRPAGRPVSQIPKCFAATSP